jgi:hypothetical protein
MRDALIRFVHLIVTAVRLRRQGRARSVIAESVPLKHQLMVLKWPRRRVQDLRPRDRNVAGRCAGLMRPPKLLRSAIVLKPATIVNLHRLLVKRKYGELFSPKRKRSPPGPKGPSAELIAAIADNEAKESALRYQRIADQTALAMNIPVVKDTVRRVLAKHFRTDPGRGGPS